MGINVAVVGLNFGAEFVPIYRDHPDVGIVGVADLDETRLGAAVAEGAVRRYRDLSEVLADEEIDAVHICTPVHLHGEMAIATLEAGKHCASAIPAALEVHQLRRIVELQSRANYMMMETAAYTREAIHVRELLVSGKLGKPVFGRGSHLQDMTGWPDYWIGFPPHRHITHAIAPLLAALDTRATTVRCLGSGTLPPEMQQRWGNPYPIETAIFELENSDVTLEVTRSLFQLVHVGTESFSLYGDKASFEWAQLDAHEHPVVFSQDPEAPSGVAGDRLRTRDYAYLLPQTIRQYTRTTYRYEPGVGTILRGGGHGGSHPHLVHEFVSSIIEGRTPWIDAVRASDWTAAGLTAHESAMQGGAALEVPAFV